MWRNWRIYPSPLAQKGFNPNRFINPHSGIRPLIYPSIPNRSLRILKTTCHRSQSLTKHIERNVAVITRRLHFYGMQFRSSREQKINLIVVRGIFRPCVTLVCTTRTRFQQTVQQALIFQPAEHPLSKWPTCHSEHVSTLEVAHTTCV